MKRSGILLILGIVALMAGATDGTAALRDMLERLAPGLSRQVEVAIVADGTDMTDDWFAIEPVNGRVKVSGNRAVSVGAGINHYLKYVAGVHLTWGNMRFRMPDRIPLPDSTIRRSTSLLRRYYLNYCTHSYSMAFWDWARWEQEIDWMMLHGIDMPLTITGMGPVWRNVLMRLGYPSERIDSFIAGPAFRAWWLMNNLEGWGGPETAADYAREEALQKRIVKRMREFGIEPVMPGYSGMLPHDAALTLGVDVADPGKWAGYTRPAFLQPADKDFDRIADIYYDELQRLYGKAKYFSMDPFHEGGNSDGVDLASAGQKILNAMKRANPESVWMIQGWQENPRRAMIEPLPEGSLMVLDLQSENTPSSRRPGGYGKHDWIYCMLLNFGGNVGLYGKLPAMIQGFERERNESAELRGVGLTMEGIENNPVMYELLTELPWHSEPLDGSQWLTGYARARYGSANEAAEEAWRILGRSVYNCPADSIQQGTRESVFCARPSDNPKNVSAWANSHDYYEHSDLVRAATLLASAADALRHNPNYRYDLVDVTRQVVADRGREITSAISSALSRGDRPAYEQLSNEFLQLIDIQDSLLATLPDFRLGSWTESARRMADDDDESADRMEWNARVQITTWGNREASERGRLHDYSNREWQGLLKDFYRPRWQRWFDERLRLWDVPGRPQPEIDFYEMESAWTRLHNRYSPNPQGDPVDVALSTLSRLNSTKPDE